MAKRTIKIYASYHFRDQDPLIQEALDATAQEAKARGISTKLMITRACDLSGVSKSTPRNWQTRKTKRFKGDTMNAFLHAMDARLGVIRGAIKKR